MTDQLHLTWLLSCIEINNAMQELTCMNYNTVEQNKDMMKARQAVIGMTL
jgi:hypothetical protein